MTELPHNATPGQATTSDNTPNYDEAHALLREAIVALLALVLDGPKADGQGSST